MSMRVTHQKITIVSVRKPARNLNNELQWFGSSLGLFNLRDKDKSCFRVFIELLKAAKLDKPLTSDEIAAKLGLSRGTVIHHINKLIESGIVIPHNNRYMLRVNNLELLVDEIKTDAERTFYDLRKVAKEIDQFLGL
jgi:predicted transcriptional regulator